jgi:hypothetical protein
MKLMAFLGALGAFASAPVMATPELAIAGIPPTPLSICGVSGENIAQIRQKVMSLPGLEKLQTPTTKFEAYADPKTYHVWNFTTKEHPAHLSVACIAITPAGTGSSINIEILCINTDAVCERFRDEYQEYSTHIPGVSPPKNRN